MQFIIGFALVVSGLLGCGLSFMMMHYQPRKVPKEVMESLLDVFAPDDPERTMFRKKLEESNLVESTSDKKMSAAYQRITLASVILLCVGWIMILFS